MAVERTDLLVTVTLDCPDMIIEVGRFAENIVQWYESMLKSIYPKLDIHVEHLEDELFIIAYNNPNNDALDHVIRDIIEDPDDDGNYPLELVVDGVRVSCSVYGDIEDEL